MTSCPRIASMFSIALAAFILAVCSDCLTAAEPADPVTATANAKFTVSSARTGLWSHPQTWQPPSVPKSGDRVLIQPGHIITYDTVGDDVIPVVQVSGTLRFATARNTLLRVCVLKVQRLTQATSASGVEDPRDHDADHAHDHDGLPASPADEPMPTLEVGGPAAPVVAPFTARIQLAYVDGFDPDEAPAIVARPGARMGFHGAPMNRAWVKLGGDAKPKDAAVGLAEAVTGWRVGDEVIVTSSDHERSGATFRGDDESIATEHRTITAIDDAGRVVTLDRPLERAHSGSGPWRGEVANLSRTVVVESADPAGIHGHTMHHRGAAGSISYARFAHLGKESKLGRYAIHFHRVGDTMRGSSVVGAAIVDSHNRWITVHGTQYMVIRDCVGYRSVGHGFFLEDGSEVYNVLDRNLGVQAYRGKRMKDQALPFDPNDGAAFWWANGRNTLTRNVAVENDEYGYRYDSQKTGGFDPNLSIRMPDGSPRRVDIRTIPVYRFADNESHSEGLYSFVFAGSEGVGPDTRHPHTLTNLTAWQTHYALRAQLPTMLVENLTVDRAAYGIYRPWFDHHVYRNLRIGRTVAEPFNRGLDDDSTQHGPISVDGLTFTGYGYGGQMPLIQISDTNLAGRAESHFRNVTVERDAEHPDRWPLVNRGGGPRPAPESDTGVPIYLHDWYGPGKTAKVVSTAARDRGADGLTYRKDAPLTGDESVVAQVSDVPFPKLLDPVDDQPPATIITWPQRGVPVKLEPDGSLIVRGTSSDNTTIARVTVNGVEAQSVDYDFAQWLVRLTNVRRGAVAIAAGATDAAGNAEQTPHAMTVLVEDP